MASQIVIEKNYEQYGFREPDESVYKTKKGLSKEIVEEISKIKKEPKWMLDFRLKALEFFQKRPVPTWGADLSGLNFDDIIYYIRPTDKQAKSWEDLPDGIRRTFEKLGIPEAERKFLAGVGGQYDSEVVYHKLKEDLEKQGVIFADMDTGVREYPEIVKKYFGTIIPPNDNKFAALNSAVWSGGSFVYIPEGVEVKTPLQAYFRINSENMGQFERTLIIAEPNSKVHYIEGCVTAGTHINTENGFVSVEEIEVGDRVLTHYGNHKEVYNTQTREYNGDLYQITCYGNSVETLSITEEHPILAVRKEAHDKEVKTEWIIPKDLGKGDFLITPIDRNVIEQDERTFSILKGNGKHGFKEISLKLKTDKDFFRLIGYYLAEGCTIGEHYVSFTFNVGERSYIEDVKILLERYFDKSSLEYKPYNNGISIVLCSTIVARFFKSNFGNSAKTKHIPKWIEFEATEKQKELIKGYWRGDGSFSYEVYKGGTQRRFRINTISKTLALQVKRILLRLDIFASLNRWIKSGNRHDSYAVVIEGSYLHSFGNLIGFDFSSIPYSIEYGNQKLVIDNLVSYVKIIGDYALSPIKEIKITKVKDLDVFNFSVKDNESYVANSIAVHNCTAATYQADALHAAVVEIIALPGSHVRYTTLQNWSTNVYNLVTKRARAYENAFVEWLDANLGSKITMKYPSVFLAGRGARAEILSIAFAGKGQTLDAGAKAIHLAPDTSSTIINKSVSKDGGKTNFRGFVKIFPGAENSKSHTKCDALILDEHSNSETIPQLDIDDNRVNVGHEATVGKVGEEQLFYLMSRGLTEDEAIAMIVNGFFETFVKELPLEYAVEFNRLIQLEMTGAVG